MLICGSPEDTHVHVSAKEKFEDTKSVKDMHYDGQNKKDQMTKLCTIKVDKSKINQTNNGCELMCFRRGSSFRSIKGSCHVTVKQNEHHMIWISCWGQCILK